MREHLLKVKEQMEKQGLEGPEELVLPDFPEVFGVVWEKFLDLSMSRSVGFQGPLSITYSDMYYWSKMTGWRLLPWEIKAIKRLDNLWHKVMKD